MRRLLLLLAAVAATAGGGAARAGCSPTNEWQDAGPRWSPDGTRIAFYRVLPGCDPAPVGVVVVPGTVPAPTPGVVPGPAEARPVGRAAKGQWPPSWSPDSWLLAFAGDRGLVVAQADGRGLRELTRGQDFAPSWSPDGGWIAFRRGPASRSELWLVRPDGTGERPLAPGLRLHDHTLPAWSPDSRELAFAAYAGASADVHVAAVATGVVRVVAPSPAHDLEPAWTPDGSVLLFTSLRDVTPRIYAAGRDGSSVRRWVDGRHAAVSWATAALAYVRRDGLWAETGGEGAFLVAERPDVLGRADWQPREADLPALAFSAGGRCKRYGIYVVERGVERRVTNPCEFRGSGTVRGTPFRDFLYGGPGRDRLLGGGRKDLLDGGAGNDVLDGDGGWDTLLGRGGDDLLIGRGDPDVIVGGTGRDRVFGGLENDTILVRDGRRDVVDCGGGAKDTVLADRHDRVARNCERVRRG